MPGTILFSFGQLSAYGPRNQRLRGAHTQSALGLYEINASPAFDLIEERGEKSHRVTSGGTPLIYENHCRCSIGLLVRMYAMRN